MLRCSSLPTVGLTLVLGKLQHKGLCLMEEDRQLIDTRLPALAAKRVARNLSVLRHDEGLHFADDALCPDRRRLARGDGLGRLCGGEDLDALEEGALGLLRLPHHLLGLGQLRPRLFHGDAAHAPLALLPHHGPGRAQALLEPAGLLEQPAHGQLERPVGVAGQLLRGALPGPEGLLRVAHPQGRGLLVLLRRLLVPQRQREELHGGDALLKPGQLLLLLLQALLAAFGLLGGLLHAGHRGFHALQAPGELGKLRVEGWRGLIPGILLL
mmetsp:Transcript_47964/g.138839  ORF Transcript_47964/g.138839 Transcript_47964/m.138839 type:complete len:269 (+) Transcript_47964:156-962(+)